jgi:hypothetical protein
MESLRYYSERLLYWGIARNEKHKNAKTCLNKIGTSSIILHNAMLIRATIANTQILFTQVLKHTVRTFMQRWERWLQKLTSAEVVRCSDWKNRSKLIVNGRLDQQIYILHKDNDIMSALLMHACRNILYFVNYSVDYQ